jgi:hypothetical protein
VFFDGQTVEALADAIVRFEQLEGRFDPKALRRRAEQFDRPVFKERVRAYVEQRRAEFDARRTC